MLDMAAWPLYPRRCRSAAIPPTNTSYWKEATATTAWVFGYDEDLIESDHWYQPGNIVEVIRYDDPRYTDREWYILGTVARIQIGSGENIICSEYWFQTVGGVVQKRRGSVYR